MMPGAEQWIRRYNGPDNNYDGAQAISVDASGNIYVTGSSYNGNNYDYATVKYSQMILSADFNASTACFSSPTEFTDLSSGTTANTQYSWDFDGDGDTDATTAGDVSYTYPSAGTYQATLTLTDGGQVQQKIVAVTVHSLPTVDLGEDINLCPGNSATLDAGSGSSYLWSTGETTQQITVKETGTYSVTITNSNGCKQSDEINVTIDDTKAPVISAITPVEVNTEAGSCAASVAFSTTVTDNCDASATPIFTIRPDGLSREISSPFTFPKGETIVYVNATDAAGNAATEQIFTVNVKDTEAPTFAANDITVQLNDQGQASIAVSDIYDATNSSDNCGIDETTLALDISSFSCVNIGANTVTLTATDGSSNSASATATVTVVDNTPPVITPPADITVSNMPGTCEATAVIGQVTATDICSANVEISHDAPAVFPGGTTTVTTAVDASGNKSYAYQYVTVTNEIPVIAGSLNAPTSSTSVGKTIKISDIVTDNNLASAAWHWNDGVVTTGAFTYKANAGTNEVSGERSFNTAGTYTVRLIVKDLCGEISEYSYPNEIVIIDKKASKTARYDDATASGQAIGEEGSETPAAFKLNVYPNPVQEELAIELESETEEEVAISIYDLLGRRIYEQKQKVTIGTNQIILDVDSWKVDTNQLLFRLQTPSKGLHQLMLLKPE